MVTGTKLRPEEDTRKSESKSQDSQRGDPAVEAKGVEQELFRGPAGSVESAASQGDDTTVMLALENRSKNTEDDSKPEAMKVAYPRITTVTYFPH